MTLTAPPPTHRHGDAEAAPHVTVLSDRCAGCQECSVRCPTTALTLDATSWTVTADDSACVGCRQCVRTCPFGAITVEGPLLVAPRAEPAVLHPASLLGDSTETRQGFTGWAEALDEAVRCLECPDPTCVRGCPAHNDIPAFIEAVGRGDLDAAQRVLRRTSILPDVCSRVCDQAVQCEGSCSWSLGGGAPVAIGALERFIADNAPVPPPSVDDTGPGAGLRVAVVGSGPAGAAAAWDLVEAGASVEVYEKDDEPGGLLRWGIPDFTLPDAVARRPWDALVAAGVDLHLGTTVPPAEIDRLLAENDAVVVAAGAGSPLRLPVPGAELAGVWDATRFLTSARPVLARHGRLADLLERETAADGPDDGEAPTVLVLGAGNTAMDAARTARRLGATVVCIDWMDRRFAPVRPDELAEAEGEGVEVRFGRTLARLEAGASESVGTAHLSVTRQQDADHAPEVVGVEVEHVDVDLVVMAMGYRVDADLLEEIEGLPVHKVAPDLPGRHWAASGITSPEAEHVAWARRQPVGRLALARESARVTAALPRRPRLWTVGDALIGPSTVVEAMTQGKQAATAILQHRPARPVDPVGPEGPDDGPSGSPTGRRGTNYVLVAFDSRTGTTERAASVIARELAELGVEVQVRPAADVGPVELAWADLLVLGSWVDGLVMAGQRPAPSTRRWAATLPWLGGLPVAVFCTYAVAAKGAPRQLAALLEARGGTTVLTAGVSRRRVDEEAGQLARELVTAVPFPAPA